MNAWTPPRRRWPSAGGWGIPLAAGAGVFVLIACAASHLGGRRLRRTGRDPGGRGAVLERLVAARTAELRAANAELEAFSYSVSHDLRAPLRAMEGLARIVAEEYGDELPEPVRDYLDRISQSAEEMARLVNALLVFSRSQRQSLTRRQVRMDDLVARAWSEVTAAERAVRLAPPRVELVRRELPACLGDEQLLLQVWTNLIGNAVKYSRGRPVARVEVGAVAGRVAPAYYVRDTGIGFDMRHAGRLFQVFQRLHRGDEYEGTGVGLALVQRIVARHGGRVWASAVPGAGATFWFTVGAEPSWPEE